MTVIEKLEEVERRLRKAEAAAGHNADGSPGAKPRTPASVPSSPIVAFVKYRLCNYRIMSSVHKGLVVLESCLGLGVEIFLEGV